MTDAAAAFACNTYSYIFSQDAERCVDHLAALGFAEFELMMYPGHLWPAETSAAARRALRQAVEANGQRIVSLNMPNIDINVAGGTAEMRRYSLGILSDVVRLAGDLRVPGVVIGPGISMPRSTSWRLLPNPSASPFSSRTCPSPSCPGSTN
jgi:L-ribulose-5-phosphate 3-epimerase